jgi:hypothetical protein
VPENVLPPLEGKNRRLATLRGHHPSPDFGLDTAIPVRLYYPLMLKQEASPGSREGAP